MSIVLSEEKYTKPHAGTISLLLLGEKAHPFHPFIHSPCVSGEEGTLAPKQASISLICMCISLSCILHLPSHICTLSVQHPAKVAQRPDDHYWTGLHSTAEGSTRLGSRLKVGERQSAVAFSAFGM